MKLSVTNDNYAATVVRVDKCHELAGLDNLVGVAVFGHQALTQRSATPNEPLVGELRIAFTAETQLAGSYGAANNLYRKKWGLNADPDVEGYLEANGRIKAIKLRGHRSDALLMPLDSLDYLGIDTSKLREGDTFDTIDGHPICRKYELPRRAATGQQQAKKTVFGRVSARHFPEHVSTANFWRNRNVLDANRGVVVTQKLHGTSARIGHVPVTRFTGRFGRLLTKISPKLNTTYDVVAGSRKVIKDGKTPGYYATDIWTHWADIIGHKIPRGYMVFGEIIGWTVSSEGDPTPIQKNYTYNLEPGDSAFYVYRVTKDGVDLPWEEVRDFAQIIGVNNVPELGTISTGWIDQYVDDLMDLRYHANLTTEDDSVDTPVALSDPKSVDEGVCVRQEAIAGPPIILKAKSGIFLQHETKLLDAGVEDIESTESVEAA